MDWWKYTNITLTLQLSTATIWTDESIPTSHLHYTHLQLQYGLVKVYHPHTYTTLICSYNMDWWKYTNITLTQQLSTATIWTDESTPTLHLHYNHLPLQYGLVKVHQPHTYTIIIYSNNMDWWKYTNLTLTLQSPTATIWTGESDTYHTHSSVHFTLTAFSPRCRCISIHPTITCKSFSSKWIAFP